MYSKALAIAKPNPSPVPLEMVDLADKALDIGYRVLADRIQKVNAFHEGTALLKNVGINVYDSKSVQRYKRLALLKVKYFLHSKYILFTILLSLAAYALAKLCGMFKDPSFPAVLFGVLACLAIGLAIFSLVVYMMKTFSNEYIHGWVTHSLESSDNPIPEDVLRIAIAVREELPKSELIVEELQTRKRVVDPFLYVRYKDVPLYVAVWNEPKFTGKML